MNSSALKAGMSDVSSSALPQLILGLPFLIPTDAQPTRHAPLRRSWITFWLFVNENLTFFVNRSSCTCQLPIELARQTFASVTPPSSGRSSPAMKPARNSSRAFAWADDLGLPYSIL